MNSRLLLLSMSAAVAAIAVTGCSRAVAGPQSEKEAERQVELTVYADDFAVVSEQRPFGLDEGSNRLGLTSISKTMDQQSVMLNWDSKEGAQIASNTYDLGVGNSGRLMERFLGKEVDLVTYGDNGEQAERIKGILEVAEPGNVVVRSEGKYLINPPGMIEAPTNTGIVTIPQLTVEVQSPSKQNGSLGLTYLTRGLSWSADYVATLAPDADEMKFECWATVRNQTGTSYPGAKITLVAGRPNRAVYDSGTVALAGAMPFEARKAKRLGYMSNDMAGEADMSGFNARVATGELQAYPVKTPATIAQDQMNRVPMLDAPGVKIKRAYSVRLPDLSSWDYGGQWGTSRRPARKSAQLSVTLQNEKADGLGLPLPAGTVRVYEPDAGNSMRYIGAARLDNTPTDTGIYLTLSDVFDVYVEPSIVSTKKVAKNTLHKKVKFVLHNSKAKDVQLRMLLPVYGKWKLISESDKGRKSGANAQQWFVKVPAGAEKTVEAVFELKG